MQQQGTLNIGANADDWRASDLSNFPEAPFELDNIRIASIEGGVQGIKFPEDDDRRGHTFSFSGREAKRMSRLAARDYGCRWVWWQGRRIKYGSLDHLELIERMIRACFQQNEFKRKALLATRGLRLVHDLGHPESENTSLRADDFVSILTRIRTELLLPQVEEVTAELRMQLGRESYDYAAVLLGAVQAAQIWKRLNSPRLVWSFYSVVGCIEAVEKQRSNYKRLVVRTNSPLGTVEFEYIQPLGDSGSLTRLVPLGRRLFQAFLARELDPRGIVANGTDRTREKILAGVWTRVVDTILGIAETTSVGRLGVLAVLRAPWLDAPIVDANEFTYFGLENLLAVS